jgi:uncharacterized protein YjbI with pentapeptide repeats
MANDVHLAMLLDNIDTWNAWRTANPDIKPDLSGANLSRANLSGANLWQTDLMRAYLSQANLMRAILSQANLSMSNLSEANLCEANLTEADLSEANLSMSNLNGAGLRIAHLMWTNLSGANLRNANLLGANLSETNLNGADLSGADLNRSTLINTDMRGAKLSGCRIFGVSVWGVNVEGAIQTDLIITDFGEPVVTVDNLEVAQFVYLLLHNEKLRDVISTIARKAVLILGRFTPERKAILDALRDALRAEGFVPIMFDFEKAVERDFTETIKILAGMALFVIADITNPSSSPLELQATVPDYAIPFVPIIQKGETPFGMFKNLQKYPWMMEVLRYDTKENLIAHLRDEIIQPALNKHDELMEKKNSGLKIRDIGKPKA